MSEPLEMTMSIPCSSEFVSVIRLAVSGLATRMNFSIEEIEDIKVSVSEACTNAIQHAYPNLKNPNNGKIDIVAQIFSNRLEITVKDYGVGFDIGTLGTEEQQEKSKEKFGLGLGLTFIKSLMDTTEFHSESGKGTTIHMIKKAPAA